MKIPFRCCIWFCINNTTYQTERQATGCCSLLNQRCHGRFGGAKLKECRRIFLTDIKPVGLQNFPSVKFSIADEFNECRISVIDDLAVTEILCRDNSHFIICKGEVPDVEVFLNTLTMS